MKTLPSTFVALCLSALAAFGQTIPNPSFELDSFTVFPGYVSGNFPITGWTGFPDASHGLNPAEGSLFANNGVIPDGVNAAFLQSTPGGTTLGTTISGLADGERYQLSFRTTARGGQTPRLDVSVDSFLLHSSNVYSVGAANPWTYVSVDFTANGTEASLLLRNNAAGDNTVNVDDFRIAPTTSPWSFGFWIDDASSGVDPAFTYTHAYNFGSAASTLINEVGFTGVAGANPSVAGRFMTTGLGAVFNVDPNNITGGSRTLANDFLFNGFPVTIIALSGLTPGQEYLFTLYSVGWEAPGARFGTFRSGNDSLSIDQDTFDNDNGIRFEYAYTADGSGSATIETWPIQNASIHWYGFTNRETTPVANAAPVIFAQPTGGVQLVGNSFTFTVASTGTRPIDYEWYHNDVLVPGESGNTLTVNIASAADAGFYHAVAENGFGSDPSAAAFLEVRESLPGLLFNSGVDGSGFPLAGGSDDPHYLLVTNPNGASLIPAIVHDPFVFPIVAGPWLANSGTSQWIGPVVDTSAAAGGDYTYQTTFDLTGLPPGAVIAGQWAVDNAGLSIAVNGVPVPGVALSPGFGALTSFVADTSLLPPGTVVSGINTLDFSVNNAGAGYTGLRIDNLTAAAVPAGIAPVIFEHPQGRDVTTGDMVVLSVRAYGSAELEYQWFKGNMEIDGATGRTYTIPSTTLDDAGTYTVVVTNGVGDDATSDPAVLTATDVPPTIVSGPEGATIGVGEDLELSVVATGSPVLEYQWQFNGMDVGTDSPTYTIVGATHDDEGEYTVTVTNPFGSDPGDPVTVLVRDVVPGIFNTGVDDTRVALPDAFDDNHYILTVNPNGAPLVPSIVENSLAFPIVGGPWVPNNDRSKWVGPAFDTAAAAGGDYTYLLSFDLTGFDVSTVLLKGDWATDNDGVAILLNGVPTGLVNTGQFVVFTSFTIDSGFVEGVNTLEFVVNNAAVGYTGLRLDSFRGLGTLLPVVDLPQINIALNGNGNPVISFLGQEGTGYRIERTTSLQTGQWFDLGPLVVPGNGMVSYEDTDPPVGMAYYHIVVTPP